MSDLAAHPEIEYLDRGDGIPVLFVHGIQGTLRAWDAVAGHLLPHHRVITLNLRGRGASPIPADPEAYSLEAFSADLESVARRVGERFVLVGYSMGVLVCLDYIQRRGCGGLRGLALVSGSACVGSEAVWFRSSDLASIAREAEQRASLLGLTAAAVPMAVAASWQHVQQVDYRDVLTQVTVPTLVVHGTQDDQCPLAHGRLLASRIPRAEWEEWAGVGHNPMAHDAARLAGSIARFSVGIAGTGAN